MADRQFEYMLLDRLKGDCDYFLGVCAEAAARGDGTIAGAERQLWAGSVESQITKMRELFDMVPEKPEWLTEEDIDRYEAEMRGLRDKGVDLRTGARAGSWKDRLVVIDTVEVGAWQTGGEPRRDALLFKPPKGGVYDKTGNMLSGYGWVAALLVVAAVAGAGYAGKQYLDARKEKDGDADGGES